MRIAYVGCGYVFDIYMRTLWAHPELDVAGIFDIDTARSAVVSQHYGFYVYPSYDALLADQTIAIVVNLTSIGSHYATIRRALEAGKHVYSEKPITTDLAQTQSLFDLARDRGLVLTGAPCNLFTDAVSTMWKAVRDGAIGKPVLIYAELDDNPAHLMRLETVQSPTGAPFPYAEELQEGCTIEHVGYHLVWMCAMFGPVKCVTAFSKFLVSHKTETPLDPADTPDFSVACFEFADGVAARVTCSWIAPRDHQMRIIGEQGEIKVDNAFHDQSHVHLERFSRVGLTARKAYTMRRQPALGSLFGIGGRRLKLLRRWKSYAVESEKGVGRTIKHRAVSWLRRREIYAQDKLLGIAEMTLAMREGRPQTLPPDFLIHLNELTLLISRAGSSGIATVPQTSFVPLLPPPDVAGNARNFLDGHRPRMLEQLAAGLVEMLHRK